MDASRFDQLARRIARPASRSALRAVIAGTAATLLGRAGVAAGTRCYGWGCPCINDRSCTDGTVCCNGICKTAGECTGSCRADGDACPHHCNLGDYCTSCCGGFCAAYGGCGSAYAIGAPGDPCDITNPSSCGPWLGCCPVRGWDVNDGVCSDACFPG